MMPVTVSSQNASRPAWLVLVVGFLLIDGLFGTFTMLLDLSRGGDLFYRLLHMLPPLSFVRWYAFGETWGWIEPFKGCLHWMTLILEIASALAMWRTPARAQKLVLTVGVAMALEALLSIVGMGARTRGFDFGYGANPCAKIGLALFVVWFVRSHASLARAEVTLLSVYLILAGLGALAPAVHRTVAAGTAPWVMVSRSWVSWAWAIQQCPVAVILSSIMVVSCGLLLRRAFAPVKAVSFVLILAGLLELADRVYASYWWGDGSFIRNLYYNLWLVKYGHTLIMVIAIALFLRRHGELYAPAGEVCRSCGYNLTGNVSGVCPECGVCV